MHLGADRIEDLEQQYGTPRVLAGEAEFAAGEFELIRRAHRKQRAHDVTVIVRDPGGRFALIRKNGYPDGIFRPPSGGIEPGESVEAGAAREVWEETGLSSRLNRYLLRAEMRFHHAGKTLEWTTHVFLSDTPDAAEGNLDPKDRKEIAEAAWGSAEEMHGPYRDRMLATGSAGFSYRVDLQDHALELLGFPPPRPNARSILTDTQRGQP